MKPFLTGIEEIDLGVAMGDRHGHPKEPQSQKDVDTAVGVFMLKNKPSVVIDLDDRFDLPGLNTNRGSSLMGTDAPEPDHDIFDEIQVGKDSLAAMWGIIEKDNERHARAGHKERQYTPYKLVCLGNHTDFLSRAVKKHHSLKKMMSVETVRKIYRAHGYEVSEYLQNAIAAGIVFSHLIHKKKPTGMAIDRHFAVAGMSSITAHTHEYAVRNTRRGDGLRQTNLTIPTLKHPARLMGVEDAGLVLFRNARNGQFRHEMVGMEEILQEYRDFKMSQRKNTDESLRKILA
ncbi:hypothetical protein [Sulfitobacter sp. 1A13679]|uniref:hypothetical protein n=1 Tax=Sulfitobacter sp. 1A13679 TaxID=3368597 RepID=UPI00374752F3